MKVRIRALTQRCKAMVDLEDIARLVALPAVVVGLWWIYHPAALIVPGVAFLGWSAWRHRRDPAQRG